MVNASTHWCDAKGLDARQRLVLFEQVLDAVSAAHGQLAIHRDLKPGAKVLRWLGPDAVAFEEAPTYAH